MPPAPPPPAKWNTNISHESKKPDTTTSTAEAPAQVANTRKKLAPFVPKERTPSPPQKRNVVPVVSSVENEAHSVT